MQVLYYEPKARNIDKGLITITTLTGEPLAHFYVTKTLSAGRALDAFFNELGEKRTHDLWCQGFNVYHGEEQIGTSEL